jgi:hypothetical protein
MECHTYGKKQLRQFLTGMLITAFFAGLNLMINQIEMNYMPTIVLIACGVLVTCIWIVKTAPTVITSKQSVKHDVI